MALSIFNGAFKSPYENKGDASVRFVFNPYPLQSKIQEGYISGYFTEKDIPMLREHYDVEVFHKLKYGWTIKENGIYPAFFLGEKGESLYKFLTSKGIKIK